MAGRPSTDVLHKRFAQMLALGHTQADAYRVIYPKSQKWPTKTLYSKASELAAKPEIKEEVRRLLDQSDLSVLDSIPRWYARSLQLYYKAIEENNLTAAANVNRQLGQAIGSLTDRIKVEGADLTDQQLIDKLAGGNPEWAAMLHKMIGKDSFDA